MPILWVVTDQLPYPPRNGITLPLYNYLLILKQTFEIKLILFKKTEVDIDANNLLANERIFGMIQTIALRRKPWHQRLIAELLGREMYQHGWYPATKEGVDASFSNEPVSVLVSPMSAVAMWRACSNTESFKILNMVAAVNDCTAAEYYFRGQSQIGNFRKKAKGLADRLRARNIGRIEAGLLVPYRAIFLQTSRDRELMAELVSPQIASKVVIAPNGVNPALLSVKRTAGSALLFVGEMSGEYGAIVNWLITDIWPNILTLEKKITLMLVGRGADTALRMKIAHSERIVHLEYVENLADVYSNAMLSICPVFKGFGLINKTIEAMACGVPVVGGMAAFNGIPGFVPDMHGAVCRQRSNTEFIEVIRKLVLNPEMREGMGALGKSLISNGFDWHDTVQRISATLTSGLSESANEPVNNNV